MISRPKMTREERIQAYLQQIANTGASPSQVNIYSTSMANSKEIAKQILENN